MGERRNVAGKSGENKVTGRREQNRSKERNYYMYHNTVRKQTQQEDNIFSSSSLFPVIPISSPRVLALDSSGISSHQQSSEPDSVEVGGHFRGCEGKLFVRLYCSQCGKFRDVSITCGDRTCPYCRARQYSRLMARYGCLVAQVPMDKMALITLTLRISTGDLKSRVKKIRVAWRKLIRQRLFLSAVSGGMYTIEIKPALSGGAKAWNVHIHALVEIKNKLRLWKLKDKQKADIILPGGSIMTWQTLGHAWAQLTGGSYVVDIQPVYGKPDSGLKYILKYMLKAPTMTENQRSSYNYALKNTRLINTFGTWYPGSLEYRFEEKKDISFLVCDECGNDEWLTEFSLNKDLRGFRKEILRL